MTGSLQTLNVLPEVSTTPRTLIGTGSLVDPPPVFTALACEQTQRLSKIMYI